MEDNIDYEGKYAFGNNRQLKVELHIFNPSSCTY